METSKKMACSRFLERNCNYSKALYLVNIKTVSCTVLYTFISNSLSNFHVTFINMQHIYCVTIDCNRFINSWLFWNDLSQTVHCALVSLNVYPPIEWPIDCSFLSFQLNISSTFLIRHVFSIHSCNPEVCSLVK